ncbi:hypothetical protein [Streptosporangium sp. NPDC002524]|uniref:hypothetical protein n=1 Tax=Streptosporangium sp. NPDC002524 TaxID=3154537 RepID=UPI00332F3E5D
MIPSPGTPAGDRLGAATWRPGAVTALRHLRTALHDHRIYPAISYDEGQPRLVISADLTVWADREGEFFTWGAVHMEEPADSARADDVPRVARQIAQRLGEHYTEPTTAP